MILIILLLYILLFIQLKIQILRVNVQISAIGDRILLLLRFLLLSSFGLGLASFGFVLDLSNR